MRSAVVDIAFPVHQREVFRMGIPVFQKPIEAVDNVNGLSPAETGTSQPQKLIGVERPHAIPWIAIGDFWVHHGSVYLHGGRSHDQGREWTDQVGRLRVSE